MLVVVVIVNGRKFAPGQEPEAVDEHRAARFSRQLCLQLRLELASRHVPEIDATVVGASRQHLAVGAERNRADNALGPFQRLLRLARKLVP